MLAAAEIVTYAFVELSCPLEDMKNNTEQGASNVSIMIQNNSVILIGAPRKDFPSKYTSRLTIKNTNREIDRGIDRYHLERVFLAFARKSKEPEKEIILNNPVMAMKIESDASKSDTIG